MASFSYGEVVVGSFVIGTKVPQKAQKVLGLSGDTNGLETEESGSLSTGYKIFENFQTECTLGCRS